MKIYTKTGDCGQTSLVGGVRVSKCCERLESYGTVDELNSYVGLLITYCTDPHDVSVLTEVQRNLFVVGSYLATDTTKTELRTSSVVTDKMVKTVECEIDAINETLPPIKLFVLPGGCRGASISHICRTVCRRAERRILALSGCGVDIDANVLAYVNRLSDYFFILARRLNVLEGHEEIIWERRK